MKMRLFDSPAMNSRIKSANTQSSERWWGYFFGPMGAAILNVTIISYINVFYTDVLDLTNSFALAAAFLAIFPIVSKIIDAITNVTMGLGLYFFLELYERERLTSYNSNYSQRSRRGRAPVAARFCLSLPNRPEIERFRACLKKEEFIRQGNCAYSVAIFIRIPPDLSMCSAVMHSAFSWE